MITPAKPKENRTVKETVISILFAVFSLLLYGFGTYTEFVYWYSMTPKVKDSLTGVDLLIFVALCIAYIIMVICTKAFDKIKRVSLVLIIVLRLIYTAITAYFLFALHVDFLQLDVYQSCFTAVTILMSLIWIAIPVMALVNHSRNS